MAVVMLPVEMAEHLTDCVEAPAVLGLSAGRRRLTGRLDRGGVLLIAQADGAAGEVAAQQVLPLGPSPVRLRAWSGSPPVAAAICSQAAPARTAWWTCAGWR